MAQVPVYYAPAVQQATSQPDDYQKVNADPSQFGGTIAQAMGTLGDTLSKASSTAADQATQYAMLNDETSATRMATDAANQIQTKVGHYLGLSGQAAVDAYPQAVKDINTIQTQTLAQATNPTLRAQLGDAVAGRTEYMLAGIGRHFGEESIRANVNASQGLIEQDITGVAAARNNPQQVPKLLAAIHGAVASQGQLQGWSADQITGQAQIQTGRAVSALVHADLADGNYAAARMAYTTYGGSMDAQSSTAVEAVLDDKGTDDTANNAVNATLYTGPMALPPSTTPDQVTNAIVMNESGGKQFGPDGTPLTSDKGAVGVGQIMAGTGPQAAQLAGLPWNPDRLKSDPSYNLALTKAYSGWLQQQFPGNPVLAVASYNAGIGAVQAAQAKAGPGASNDKIVGLLPAETQTYVKRAVVRLNPNGVTPALSSPGTFDRDTFSTNLASATAGLDPTTAAAVQAKGDAVIRQQDTLAAAGRSQTDAAISDLEPRLISGDPNAAIPVTQIQQNYPASEAAQRISDLNTLQSVGRTAAGLKFATPAEQQQALDDLKAGVGPLAAAVSADPNLRLNPDGSAAAPDSKANNLETATQFLQGQLKAQATALHTDAAGYVLGDPTVQQAYATWQQSKSPADMQSYVAASLAVQTRMGVPPNQQQVLPASVAKDLVGKISQNDPSKTDMGTVMDQAAQSYGAEWPSVFKQLVGAGLPSDYQIVASVTSAAGRADLVRAIQTGPKTLEANIGGANGATAKAINTAVQQDTSLQQFGATQSIPGWSGGSAITATVRDSVNTLAQYYAMQGANPADAVNRATQTIIGDKYDFDGTMRTPAGMLPQVNQLTQNMETGLTPKSLDPRYTDGSEVANQRLQDVINAPKTWVTNGADDGVTMTYRGNDGVLRPVMGANGQPVGFKFSQVSKMIQAQTANNPGGHAPAPAYPNMAGL